MPDLVITQVKSVIGSVEKQRATLRGLGLRRIRHTVVQPDNPQIRGMIAKVSHLVEVRDAADGDLINRVPKRSELRKLGALPAANISPVEQHAAGLTTTDAPDRPASPGTPDSESASATEDQPSTGPSGETSTSSAPGTSDDAAGSSSGDSGSSTEDES